MTKRAMLGVVALLGLPLVARAQRVEVAFLGGFYRPTPMVWEGPTGIECDDVPCPYYFREVLETGAMLGGRVTVGIGSRFGLDLVWQRASGTARVTYTQDPGGQPIDQWSAPNAVTVFSVQPHLRLGRSEDIQAVIGLGAAVMGVTESWGGYRIRNGLGLAVSVSLRARLVGALSFDARASHAYFGGARDHRHHLFGGVGVAFAISPR